MDALSEIEAHLHEFLANATDLEQDDADSTWWDSFGNLIIVVIVLFVVLMIVFLWHLHQEKDQHPDQTVSGAIGNIKKGLSRDSIAIGSAGPSFPGEDRVEQDDQQHGGSDSDYLHDTDEENHFHQEHHGHPDQDSDAEHHIIVVDHGLEVEEAHEDAVHERDSLSEVHLISNTSYAATMAKMDENTEKAKVVETVPEIKTLIEDLAQSQEGSNSKELLAVKVAEKMPVVEAPAIEEAAVKQPDEAPDVVEIAAVKQPDDVSEVVEEAAVKVADDVPEVLQEAAVNVPDEAPEVVEEAAVKDPVEQAEVMEDFVRV